jgi:AGCS family alanine or glycine:cation symporter
MVPVMAVVYGIIVVLLLIINIGKFPGFIADVVVGAFSPQAIFGGGMGIALSQGVKRGLLSNEAGQGTITPAAAITECDHPATQGFVQSLGVFLDTIVICTMTGFILCGAKLWENAPDVFETLRSSKIDYYLASLAELTPGAGLDNIVAIIICLCYALFAFTSLLGLISFSVVISANISKNKGFITAIRILGALIFVPIGIGCVLAGLELDNIWYASDLFNIALVFVNAPVILVGGKYAFRALKDYEENGGRRFVASDIGLDLDTNIWTEEERAKRS